ncbi:hypothetical protein C2G38_2173903 [Gigaspora rosea]|uniref:J domain-containing protein n=2 Tax=Gigaspora rosea TaxID=44941 RepID=A0A397VTT9_9GLOM|nr:hypothetical protein C2G38_2173903 [Gigaspora rosea]
MPRVKKSEFYKTLEIKSTATLLKIKQAYRKLALVFHPDRNVNKSKNEQNSNNLIIQNNETSVIQVPKYVQVEDFNEDDYTTEEEIEEVIELINLDTKNSSINLNIQDKISLRIEEKCTLKFRTTIYKDETKLLKDFKQYVFRKGKKKDKKAVKNIDALVDNRLTKIEECKLKSSEEYKLKSSEYHLQSLSIQSQMTE